MDLFRVLRDDGVALCFPYAHLAPTDVETAGVLLQRLPLRAAELFVGVDDGQPETQLVGEVMARAPRPVALNERRCPEIFQARARTGQRLTAALGASGRVLHRHDTNSIVGRNDSLIFFFF